MEREGRTQTRSVIDDLVANRHRFEFFRAVSLVRAALEARGGDSTQGPAKAVGLRFRASPTMGVPAAEITGFTRVRDADGRNGFEMEVPFLGLYGPSSPLPAFVTEHVVARDRNAETLRDFLDLFNHRAIEILYGIWRKYRHAETWRPDASDPISGYVVALMGLLGLRHAGGPLSIESLLPFSGALALAGGSATLVEALVSRQLGGVRARVEELVPRRAVVDDAQQGRLGRSNTTLGEDWVLGARIPDRMGKFRLWLGPLGIEDYRDLLPGHPGRRRLARLIEATVGGELEYDVVLTVREEDVAPWRLGRPAALGRDAWLAGDAGAESTIVSAP